MKTAFSANKPLQMMKMISTAKIIELRRQPRSLCSPSAESGVAIITVMLIIALMVTLLGFLIEQQHLMIRRMANQNVAEQGYQYAAGVDAWAARLLHDDADRVVDYAGEDWARFGVPEKLESGDQESFSLDLNSAEEKKKLPTIDFGIAGIEYKIDDLQGRFNLNNLANREPVFLSGQKSIFLNLLQVLEVGEFDAREQLYAALVDWLDDNDTRTPAGGAESSDYQIKSTPYYAADQKLTSLGELRFIEGFDEKTINAIAPYVTVLPIENAKININSTSTEVLASLSAVPVVDTSSVDLFLAEREDENFLGFQPNQIQNAEFAIIGASPSGGQFVRNMMQTNSYFFRVTTRVVVGDYHYCGQTTVLREGADPDSSARVTIINRQHNTLCDEIVH